ncbi:MAG: aspartate kinase [Alicyclobacillus sp.]|nr:aspartate kinase [Alicyclobacillus sp.]
MKVLVQKFGGTSVASPNLRTAAARHVQQAVADGYSVVVVVSAMGRKGDPYATDTLLQAVPGEDAACSPRELDILLSCGEAISAVVFAGALRAAGLDVCVLSGAQAGIVTNEQHGDARILEIRPQRIVEALERGCVVVVMGFQGTTAAGDVTTLGRGGSDTTATALGVALGAEYVDIFTDVDGIMTADPRIVSDAKRLKQVTYTEICNMAYQGAKVIHPRAVEIAMQRGVPIRVRRTLSDDEGTLVTNDVGALEATAVAERLVTGIAHTAHVDQLVLTGAHLDAAAVFRAMAQHRISVDFISVSPERIAYTVAHEAAEQAVSVLQAAGFSVAVTADCAKVAVVGAGIAGVPGVMARIAGALATEGIPILQSADSHTTIWCLVPGLQMTRAVQALHRAFELAS